MIAKTLVLVRQYLRSMETLLEDISEDSGEQEIKDALRAAAPFGRAMMSSIRAATVKKRG